MNWGTKLVIGMLSFMSFIVVLGVLMFNSKTDALVDNDYYEKGLTYNADYNRKEQVKADNAGPQLSVDQQNIILSFKSEASGIINLQRSSDKSMDQRIAMQTDENHQAIIPLKGIARGQWRVIISWVSDGKSYLDEQEIYLP